MDRKYIAFISYRHLPLDMAVAKKLHRKIERYRVPAELRSSPEQKRLGIVFRDREELPLSNDLTQNIYDALDNSEYLIVVCTPDTPKSLWVQREIQHFLRNHDRNHILTVLAAGTPEESIPPQITHIYDQDGTVIDRKEPLCAYIVADQKWKVLRNLRGEFHRLVAAIVHKPLDAIRQRAKIYRWKLIGSLMAIIIAVSLGFTGMLLSKNRQIQNQLNQVLLNESKILTLVSQNRLEDGDRLGALESALQALPSPGNQRPYYQEAEVALEKALYLYEWPKYRAQATITELSGLTNVAISDDGKYAIGLAGSDKTVCYDLATRQPMWECNWLDDYSIASLAFLEDQEAILYTSYGGGQFVLDLHTGRVLHSCTVSKRVLPEDFTGDKRQVALIDVSQVVFFDTQTGKTLSSEAIDRGETLGSISGAYSADGKTFLAVYSDTFNGDRQLRYTVIDTETGAILHSSVAGKGLSESVFDLRIIGLDDGSFFVALRYEDGRYFYRVSGKAEEVASNGYGLSGGTFVRTNLHNRIQLVNGVIFIAENGFFLTIDPMTCQILTEHSLFSDAEYCYMFADGSIILKDDKDQLNIYEVSEDGTVSLKHQYAFPWDFTTVIGSVRYPDTFLARTNGDTTLLIVSKLGLLGTEKANTQKLPFTLSGSLVYLPKYCGIYCSPESDAIYFKDTSVTGEELHFLYHAATSDQEAIDPPDIHDYTGITGYAGPIPQGIGETVNQSAVSKNGNLAAFICNDGTLYLYDIQARKLRFQIPLIVGAFDSVTFLQDDTLLLNNGLGIYSAIDTVSGEIIGRFEAGQSSSGQYDYHTQIRESTDGEYLFICSSIAEFEGAIVKKENWTVIHRVEGMVGYLPALDSLVYVSEDFCNVYLQKRLKTEDLTALATEALSAN